MATLTDPTLSTPGREALSPRLRGGSLVGDRYELEQPLGRGGHGEVWEALDTLSRQRVAVKLFRNGDHAHAARVRREIAVLRMLRLPGVVAMLDEGRDGDTPYMVMERVDGTPFPARALPMPWSDLADCAHRLIEVLGRIHSAGIIHRDIKPSNVLVGDDRRVTVLDFGLSFPQASSSDRLTGDFEFMGTPAYLAPEQLTGDPVGPETDLYSVGVMLYESLTGALPHKGAGTGGLLADRLTRKPRPISELVPELPPAVSAAVMQLLEIQRDARPRSAELLLHRLRDGWVSEVLSLPRLGDPALIPSIARDLREGRAVDVCGPPGSGRSRALEDVAAALRSEGVTVLVPTRGAAPLATARSILPESAAPSAELSLETAIEQVTRALSERLTAGEVIIVDDLERVDALSSRVFARCRDAGGLLRASVTEPFSKASRTVRLAPLSTASLEALFLGPERLFHLRSEGAQRLHERTEGRPRAVHDEVNAWVRAGMARWVDDSRLVIDRPALDRIALDARPMRARLSGPPPRANADGELPAHLTALAQWLDLAGANASTTVLVELTREPRWLVEAELDELRARGIVRFTDAGHPMIVAPREDADRAVETRTAAHRALALALPPGRPGRMIHLLASGASEDPTSARELVSEAILRAEDLARDGRLGPAMVLLSDALRALRPLIDGGLVDSAPLLSSWVELAILANTPAALDAVLYEITRVSSRSDTLEALEQLVRAALAVSVWDARAAVLVESLAPFESLRLELARATVRVLAARRVSLATEEARIGEVTVRFSTADDPIVTARCAQWNARLQYRRGDFADAARRHEQAANLEPWLSQRAVALLDAASASMEAFELDRASRNAREALSLAEVSKNPPLEARAEWLLRAIAYRSERALPVDHALLEAAAQLGSRQMESLLSLGEAAFAFRAGAFDTAGALAERAYTHWSNIGESLGVLLAGALALRCGRSLGPDAVESIRARALACPSPGVGVQALALLADGGVSIALEPASIEALVGGVPRAHWGRRMELLSVSEALERLRGAG